MGWVLPLALGCQFALAAAGWALARHWAQRRPDLARGRAGSIVLGGALLALVATALMRLDPVRSVALLGPALASCTEFTVALVPAGVFFALITPRLPRAGDRKAVACVLVLAAVLALRGGWWMLAPPPALPGPTRWNQGVCLQSTEDTCVPASMVTLLAWRGVSVSEAEMARLSFVEPDAGTTDTRALWALRRALTQAGRGDLRAVYRRWPMGELGRGPWPVMASLDWGVLTNHMVCVLEVSGEGVLIADPLEGPRRMALAEFSRRYRGRAIMLEDRPARP